MAAESDAGLETKANKSGKHKVATVISCLIWILSIVLSFMIPPSSAYIWVPDAILLLGFFPLIFICPYSLVWIAFGILTSFIGFFLLLLTNIPEAALPLDTHKIKQHLEEYHPCWSWMLIGLFGTVSGFVKLSLNILRRIQTKRS